MRQKIVSLILLALVSSVALTACSSETGPIPTPLANYPAAFHMTPVWTRQVDGGTDGFYLRLSPAINARNELFVASYAGVLESLNADTGRILWRTSSQLHYASGVALSQHLLFVVTSNAQLLALRQDNGQVVWETPTSAQVLAAPQVGGGMVLVHAMDGTLTAYSQDDGHQVWQYKTDVPDLILHLGSRPEVAGPYAVSGFANGTLSVFSLSNGKNLWTKQISEPEGSTVVARMVDVDVSPIIVNGIVFVASYQGKVVALNVIDGSMMWQHAISAYAGLAANSQSLYVVDATGQIWSFDEQTGAVLWRQNALLNRGLSGPVITPKGLVVGDEQGYLHWLSRSDGHLLSRVRVGSNAIVSTPLYHHGMVYAYTTRGRLVAYR